jgi:hypothetical protein
MVSPLNLALPRSVGSSMKRVDCLPHEVSAFTVSRESCADLKLAIHPISSCRNEPAPGFSYHVQATQWDVG